jgi:hypothetical protein
MAMLKLAVAITRVNARYDANVTYQQGYMAGIAGTIPVERNEATGRLEVDEANLPAIAKVFGLTKKPQPAAKPKPTAKPTAKPKPSKPAPNRPVRSRAARSASAA